MKQLYSRYFPTPSYLSMNSFALDISDSSIKYGELLATQDGLRLGRFGQEKIPAGIIVSGKIEDEKALIAILKNLKDREQLRFVRVSLPDEQMYLFTLSVPHIEGNDLKEAIHLQIEEYIPLSAADTIFDYSILSKTSQSKTVEVVAIATSTAEKYLSVLLSAGFSPLSFELEAQAAARAAIPANEDRVAMIVDFGKSRTGLSIASNKMVYFTTTLDIGGDTLTNMIAKNFSLSFKEAEDMKLMYALGSDSDINDIFPIMLNGLSVMRDELNKHYTYWKTHNDANIKEVDRIILCGGDSNLRGLAEYLQASMKMKVTHLDAWTNISDMKNSVPDMSFQESLGYVTMLGLALGDYADSPQSIFNVLPDKQKEYVSRLSLMRRSNVALFVFAVTCLIAIVLLLPSYFFSISKMDFADQQLEAFDVANPQIASENIDTTVNDANAKLALLSRDLSDYQVHTKAIESLLSDRTTGITFSQIIYAEKTPVLRTLEVHGTSATRDGLYTFKSSLDSDPNFTKVDLPISYFIGNTNISFIITITMK